MPMKKLAHYLKMNVNPFHGNEVLDEHLSSLHREMKSLRLECDRLINKHLLVESTLNQTSAVCHNPDTSSAYNTGGESCRSNSITPDANHSPPDYVPRSPRMIHRSQPLPSPKSERRHYDEPRVVDLDYSVRGDPQKNRKPSPMTDFREVDPCDVQLQTPGYSEVKRTPSRNSNGARAKSPKKVLAPRLLPRKDSSEYAKRFRIPSFSIVLRDQTKPRKTEQKLQESIPLPNPPPREKLYMFDRPVEELTESEDGEIAGTSERAPDTVVEAEPVQYKWKVKRRCDGSRYVVKRPFRSQILKKREAQLLMERTTGMSTDDDAHSELKIGHFHRREERKGHLEKERERKEKEQQRAMETKLADQTIVRLSQRKMQKKKEQMLLDGFVTTQEVLSQRNAGTTGKHGILSVTTV